MYIRSVSFQSFVRSALFENHEKKRISMWWNRLNKNFTITAKHWVYYSAPARTNNLTKY